MPGFGVVPFDPVDQVLALIQAIDMASQADEIGFLLLIEAPGGMVGGRMGEKKLPIMDGISMAMMSLTAARTMDLSPGSSCPMTAEILGQAEEKLSFSSWMLS